MTAPLLPVVLALCAGCGRTAGEAGASKRHRGIAPEEVADYVHTVIQADRETYAEQVVHRLQNVEQVIKASEEFKEDKALPLPSQMLRMGAETAAKRGKLRYALISTWAINKANLPKTEFEKHGLEAVIADPETPYRSYQTIAGKQYFLALYADRAVSQACINCHNQHAESPRDDFKLGDVMGGVVVSLPLE